MNILYINAVCGTGSTGRIVTELMQTAKSHGHNVKIACATVEPAINAAPDEIITVGSKSDYYVHNALSRITDHEGMYSKSATKKLIRQIKCFKPDVVHLHNLHGHWLNYELLFQFLAEENLKVVWTLHDCWAFTGHCAYFSMLNCSRWESRCEQCTGLRSYPVCRGKGDVSNNFDRKKQAFTSVNNLTLVTPSQWLADTVRRSFLNRYNILAIPNGIDLEVFKPTDSEFKKKKGITDKKMILGVANVWSKRKGFNDILRLRDILSDDYCIVLVGLSQEQINSLPKGIIGIQRTANIRELVEIYSSADVFINPSYEETMGMVTAEALACGTPAVVYNKTAVPEIVDTNSGIVVEAGDISEFSNAVKKIIANPFDFTGAVKRAETYEKKTQYEKYIRLY